MRSRAWVGGVVVLAAACGARVTDAQRASLAPSTARAVVQAAAGEVSAGDSVTATTTATGASAAAATATGGQATSGPAQASGNGGATDIGVTATSIKIGNISTLSGPVPGVFQGALIGAQAAAALQNSKGGLYGRRIEIVSGDDQLDAAQNRAVTEDMVNRVFAFGGSLGVYDDGGADAIGRSGLPDVSPALSGAHRRLPNNFNIAPAEDGGVQLAPFNYYKQRFPKEIQAAGTLFGDVPISRQSQMSEQAAGESVGWKFVYSRGYQVTETDFTADVIRMRQVGVKLLFLAGSDPKTLARIATAMKQQNFSVPIVTMNIGYDHQLATLGGEALDGMLTTMQASMFAGEDAAAIPEVKLMDDWIARVKPGFQPDLYSMLGWASGRLLIEAMEKVGPNLTRAAVSQTIRAMGDFDDHGLLAPGNPGRKTPPTCIVVTQFRAGKWQRVDTPPTGYRCDLGGFFRSRS